MTLLRKRATKRASRSPIVEQRSIPALARLVLFVCAGGRCEFDGCNRYLLEHHLTLREGNFAEIAHIVAFRPEGPRGRDGHRPLDIHDVSNLMLLCPNCHKLIDDRPRHYTRKSLEEYKDRHERRILHVTGLGPGQRTSVMIVMTNVANQKVSISYDQILEAVAPRYPVSRQGTVIDLTQIHGDHSAFIATAQQTLQRRIERLYDPGGEAEQSGHLSLFAIAPIPLLVFLGSQLSNKVPLDLYQRHRDTEGWTWKKNGKQVSYKLRLLRRGSDRARVALIASLSGTIRLPDLPDEIDEQYSVYELTLRGETPNPTFLRTKSDLENFRRSYQAALGTIVRDHGLLRSIHFFPAVPAPIAVLCGRELLAKVHPELLVYDYNKTKGGFTFQVRINNHGQE